MNVVRLIAEKIRQSFGHLPHLPFKISFCHRISVTGHDHIRSLQAKSILCLLPCDMGCHLVLFAGIGIVGHFRIDPMRIVGIAHHLHFYALIVRQFIIHIGSADILAINDHGCTI